jgi:hypothetical protein
VTANTISGAAFIVSALALIVSWRYGHRSANVADRSAKAAEGSAEDARRVRKAELEREHRDYAPVMKEPDFNWDTNERSKELNQFLTFKLPNTYRVFGDTLHRQDNGSWSRSPIAGATGNVLEAGTPQRLYVSSERAKQPDAIELRFFPPASGDPGESWSCPCDRPSSADDHATPGHWVIRLDVPERPEALVAWA